MPPSPDTETPLPLAAGFAAADDAQWRALVDKVLKGADFRRRLVTRTADGIEIEPLYTRPAAGDAPQTHGVAINAHRGWRIAQVRTEPTPDAFAAAALEDIEGGADALTLR